MARIPKGGAGSSRGLPRMTARSSRSVGEELVESGFGAIIPVGFKGVSRFADGFRSNTWTRQLQYLKNNVKTIGTGRRYDAKGNVVSKDANTRWWGAKSMVNRAGAVASIPMNVMVGAPLAAAGKATKLAGMGVAGAAMVTARPAARALGMTTYEGGRVIGQVLNGGIKTLRAPGMMDLAMAGTLVGGTAIGLGLAINEIGGGNRSFNGYASGLAGTTGMAPTPMVNTGANGDLVLAMHKLR